MVDGPHLLVDTCLNPPGLKETHLLAAQRDVGLLHDLLDAPRQVVQALDAHGGTDGTQQCREARRIDEARAQRVQLLPRLHKRLKEEGESVNPHTCMIGARTGSGTEYPLPGAALSLEFTCTIPRRMLFSP